MLLEIIRFEVNYNLRRPATYIYFAILFLLSFLFMTTDAVVIGGGTGNILKNSPFVVARSIAILTLFGSIITTAIAGTAILRDFEYKSHELFFTTKLTKPAYLLGRFIGSFLCTLLSYSGIIIGLALGSVMWWLEPDKVAPFNVMTYLVPFVVFVVPNVLFFAAMFFAVGTLSRNMLVVYVQGIALLVLYNLAGYLLQNLDNDMLSALADPFGVRAFGLSTRYWTPAEKNALHIPLESFMLYNRLLWLGISAGVVALTYQLFRFSTTNLNFRRKKNPVMTAAKKIAEYSAISLPPTTLQFTLAMRMKQLAAVTTFHLRSIIKEIPFLAISIIGMITFFIGAVNADSLFGTTVYPVTYIMGESLNGFALFFLILTTFYAGELTWRERQLRLAQTHDALPLPTWLSLAGKIVALCLAQAGLLLLLILTAIIVQTSKGYYNYEPLLYLKFAFGTMFPGLLQITLLAFFIHTLVNNKYLGHIVVVLFYIAQITLSSVGFEHHLYNFGTTTEIVYSDMNAFGHFVWPRFVFESYWLTVAVVLAAISNLFWVRGTESGGKMRMRIARARLTKPAVTFSAACIIIVGGTGGYIFYNTNVLNKYETSKDSEAQTAKYEKLYKKYARLPQPRVVGVFVNTDIFPETRIFVMRGHYTVVNKSGVPIDTLAVNFNAGVTNRRLDIDIPHTTILHDTLNGFALYKLTKPMLPGDSAKFAFDVIYDKPGFANSGSNTNIVGNGTFINSGYLPTFGYSEDGELTDDDDRKEQGLPRKERMASIDDTLARRNTYISNDADWIDFETIVSTSSDQIAIAPGYLQKEWQSGGRRYFHYKMDSKILNFYSFLSARYEVFRDTWNGVNIEIYYHKGHEYNLARMNAGIKASLEYFTKNYSPYQHRQVRIIEFPRYATFAQSFPNTIPYSESIGFIARIADPAEDLDFPYYVTAHEVAHQWWAHQVIGGNVQGSTLLSESLAEYSALMVMEKEYGRDRMKKFLHYDLDRYLRGRSVETKKELPLMLVENQQYIHYNKGSLIMYALRDYIGEAALNTALAKFIHDKAFQQPPYTNAREFVGYLRDATPDSLKYLIGDFFETITLYENKAESADAKKLSSGTYQVTLKITAKKLKADSLGNERPVALGDWIDIGIFDEHEDPASKLGKPLYLQKYRITKPEETIVLTVAGKPKKAGIDPYNKLIDRTPEDNAKEVNVQ